MCRFRLRRGASQHEQAVYFMDTTNAELLQAPAQGSCPRHGGFEQPKEIFSKKVIFIPINKREHWSLCAVLNPGAVVAPRRRGEIPCILFFDPLRSRHKITEVQSMVYGFLNGAWSSIRPEGGEPFRTQSMGVLKPMGKSVALVYTLFSGSCHS
jgi:Ulp1 protease family, C-terminal catalytic domain